MFSGTSASRVQARWIKLSNINRRKYLEGSGVAVKKWMQGRLVSLGRIDTMLPVVQNPPESMQMPLALSLSIAIMTSAVTDPGDRKGELSGSHQPSPTRPMIKPGFLSCQVGSRSPGPQDRKAGWIMGLELGWCPWVSVSLTKETRPASPSWWWSSSMPPL